MKQVNFNIEEHQHEKLFNLAHKNKMSMNNLIRYLIDELDENKEIEKEDKP